MPNTLLLCFINGQFAVLYWGNTFVSAPMLDNLDSVRALSRKAVFYILTAVLVIVFSLLPVCRLGRLKLPALLGIPAILYVAVIGLGFIQYSPFSAAIKTYEQMTRWDQFLADMDGEVDGSEFFQAEVADYRARPEGLPPSPNVVLVFVEGLSQNIIDDPRNIMPNLRQLQERSIFFENYYNHSFATYMALSGQLYSGYQYENYDKNNLVSLQDIFSYYGYQTTFINTEPNNSDFSSYLADFEFDTLINDPGKNGEMGYVYDKGAYELLFETAEEMAREGQPFFLSMYSFGTHVGWDSMDQKFGDGNDPLLNKFYNADVHIGRFMERLAASELAEDTLVVITADHATYGDADFTNSFPDHERRLMELDEMPLMLYYSGVEPESWDAGGRNSIDMAPTLLDFLDMSAANYFWGKSLFAPADDDWTETTFSTMGHTRSTRGGEIHDLEIDERTAFEARLARYLTLKILDIPDQTEDDEVRIYASMNADGTALDILVNNADEFVTFRTAVWSFEGDQDDLVWFSTQRDENGEGRYSVDLSSYTVDGRYWIHVYGFREGEEKQEFVGSTTAIVTLPSRQTTGDLEERSE